LKDLHGLLVGPFATPAFRTRWRACRGPSAAEPERAGVLGGPQSAQGPVPTRWFALARARAERTTVSGTANPPRPPPPVVAANTVPRTRPPPSTTGPPELPDRTLPRSAVTSRVTGPRP